MSWRYGIVKYHQKSNPEVRFYGIGELYFDKDPLQPHSCTLEPIEPYVYIEDGVTEELAREEILSILNAIVIDCSKYPVFDIDGPYAECPWNKSEDLKK